MFLSSEDVQTGSEPLSIKWIRLFPNNQEKQLVVAFSHSLMVYEYMNGSLQLLFRQSIQAPLLEMHVIPREELLAERLVFLLDECNKISILECINYRFVNVELHHFPEMQYRHELAGPDSIEHTGRVAVDPQGRCLGLRLFRNYLALIPQTVDTLVDEVDRLPSWVTNFYEMDERFQNVTRICFLPGYIEPTIALLGTLSGNNPTGRASSPKDQTWFAIATCQLISQKYNTIFYLGGLPNDLEELMAVPRPTGGVLAYGCNSLVHLEQGSPGIGLALNSYAPKLSSFKYISHLATSTTFSQGLILTNKTAVCLGDGHVLFGDGLVLRLKKSSRFVNKMELTRQQNMKCFHFTLYGELLATHNEDLLELYKFQLNSAAKSTPASLVSNAVEDTDIYLAELAQETQQHTSGKLDLQALASITCTSKVQHFALGRKQTTVVTDTGSLYVYPHTLPFETSTSFEIPGSQEILTVEVDGKHLLVSSTATATLVLLKDEDRIKEVESSGFYLQEPTLFAAKLGNRIIQVTPERALLLETQRYNLITSVEGRFIKAAVYETYLALLEESADFTIYVLQNDNLKQVNSAKNIKTFDFDAKRKALRAIDADGVLSCLQKPFESIVFVNANFSALPPLLSNHLQNVPNVKAPIFKSVEEIKVLDDLVLVLSDNQFIAYKITNNTLVKVYSQRITKGDYNIVSNSKDLIVLLGPESFAFHVKALRSIPFSENQFTSVSFVSQEQFIGVKSGKISICIIDERYQWSPVMGLVLHSKLASSLSHILYHPASDCFLVISREPVEWKLPTDEYSSISDQLDADLPDKPILPTAHEYKVGIVSSLTWTLIDTFVMREYETVLQLRLSTLDTKQTSTGKKAFVTIGTALNKGEDRPVRGRAIVLDIVDVVPEPGRPETNLKLRLLAFQEVKGPVMTHCEIDGCLLVAMASKIIIHALENDDTLTGIAFVDSGVASISSAVLKNYFLLGDINMGASFFAFQKEPPKIAALGKDMSHHGCIVELRCVEFCVQDAQVVMCGGDQVASLLHFYSYAPLDRRTGSGQKLLYLGCLRLSSPPVRMLRNSCCNGSEENTLNLMVLCQDGTIKRLRPIKDIVFRKGLALSARLTSQLLTPQAGGLLPRSVIARPFGADPEIPHPLFSSLIDLSFNRQQVLDLSVPQQQELARITNLDVDDLFL